MSTAKAIEWTLNAAGREFGIHRDTLKNRLAQQSQEPNASGCYSTQQITKAIYGDIAGERLRKTKEEADKLELENRRTRGELIPVDDAVELVHRFCFAIRQKIILSPLPDADKQAIILDIRGLKEADYTQINPSEENGAGAA